MGAVAALIYPDQADYKTMSEDTELYGHVSYAEEWNSYGCVDCFAITTSFI